MGRQPSTVIRYLKRYWTPKRYLQKVAGLARCIANLRLGLMDGQTGSPENAPRFSQCPNGVLLAQDYEVTSVIHKTAAETTVVAMLFRNRRMAMFANRGAIAPPTILQTREDCSIG